MIQDVFLDHSTYNQPPNRFEAGTPAIAEAIGLGAACDYLSAIGMDVVHRHESELGAYLYKKVELFGPLHDFNHNFGGFLCHGYRLALCTGSQLFQTDHRHRPLHCRTLVTRFRLMQAPLTLDGTFASRGNSGVWRVQLSEVEGVTIYGPPPSHGRAALCSFNVEGLHATDVSTLLDASGAAT